VSRVIYLDPFSTRWTRGAPYIDSVLDDDDVVCGRRLRRRSRTPFDVLRPRGQRRVYQINQATGAFDLHASRPDRT